MHEIFKLSYYKNYLVDFNQIFRNDKDLQVLIVGGPKMHPINPRWWMVAILKKK